MKQSRKTVEKMDKAEFIFKHISKINITSVLSSKKLHITKAKEWKKGHPYDFTEIRIIIRGY